MIVVGVVYQSGGRVEMLDPNGIELHWNDRVICEAPRGEEYGRVVQTAHALEGKAPERVFRVLRTATPEDDALRREQRERAAEVRRAFRRAVVERHPRAAIKVVNQGPATALIDGDNGMGHLVVERATRLASELAATSGIAWVGTRNSNHAGAGGVYVSMLTDAGLIGLYGAVSGFNQMAPWGGAEALLGTNPLAIGIPAGKQPAVIIDTATSVASAGMIKAAA